MIASQYSHRRLVAVYDQINSGDRDYQFYCARIGPAPLSVLDLGCGTGTLALSLAALGHRVSAMDPAVEMLSFARQRPGAHQIAWLQGDAPQLAPEGHYDRIVMTGHAFQCLLSDEQVDTTLRALRQRLAPGGRLMFESRNPCLQPWLQWVPELSRRSLLLDNGECLTLYHQVLSQDGEQVTFQTPYHFSSDDVTLVSQSTLRFMTRAQIERHLRQAGFTQVQCLGWWDGALFDEFSSPEMIVLAG